MLDRVFICSPYRGDPPRNLKRAIQYCRKADINSKLPIAPHVYFTRVFPDENGWRDRYIGMYWGKQLMADCKEIWIFCNELTEGMIEEISEARKLGLDMKFYNENREEINNDNYLIHTEIGPAYRRLIAQHFGDSFYFEGGSAGRDTCSGICEGRQTEERKEVGTGAAVKSGNKAGRGFFWDRFLKRN